MENSTQERKSSEEEEEEIKKKEIKKEEKDKEKILEINISKELNKPDEIKTVDNKEYIDLINKKINNYKKEVDANVNKFVENEHELKQQEKKFNNIKELINISEKVINYIQKDVDTNTRELEDIFQNQEKIISDLDNIEEN